MRKTLRFHDGEKGIALAVRLVPRASRNQIVGIMEDGSLRVKVTAPPVDGRANLALIDYLAEVFDSNRANIEIIAGEHSRNKIVSILNIDPDEVDQKIQKFLMD